MTMTNNLLVPSNYKFKEEIQCVSNSNVICMYILLSIWCSADTSKKPIRDLIKLTTFAN